MYQILITSYCLVSWILIWVNNFEFYKISLLNLYLSLSLSFSFLIISLYLIIFSLLTHIFWEGEDPSYMSGWQNACTKLTIYLSVTGFFLDKYKYHWYDLVWASSWNTLPTFYEKLQSCGDHKIICYNISAQN